MSHQVMGTHYEHLTPHAKSIPAPKHQFKTLVSRKPHQHAELPPKTPQRHIAFRASSLRTARSRTEVLPFSLSLLFRVRHRCRSYAVPFHLLLDYPALKSLFQYLDQIVQSCNHQIRMLMRTQMLVDFVD